MHSLGSTTPGPTAIEPKTNTDNLLPAGSEEHEVLQIGSIHVAILPSCQILFNNGF